MTWPNSPEPTEEQRRIAWEKAPAWAAEAGWAKPAGYRTGWYAYDPDLDDARPVPGPEPAPLTLQEADRLAEQEPLQTPAPEPCMVCGGSGDDPADGSACPSCGGWGLER